MRMLQAHKSRRMIDRKCWETRCKTAKAHVGSFRGKSVCIRATHTATFPVRMPALWAALIFGATQALVTVVWLPMLLQQRASLSNKRLFFEK